MDNLASTENDPSTSYVIDTLDTTAPTNLQQPNQDSNGVDVNDNNAEGLVKDNALIGANPGYADSQNTLDGTLPDNNMEDDTAILDSDADYSTAQPEQDHNDEQDSVDEEIDTLSVDLATIGMNSESDQQQQQEDRHVDDYDQQQENVDMNASLEKADDTFKDTTYPNDDGKASDNFQQNDNTEDDDDEQQTWNDTSSDDMETAEAQPEEEEEETMEQGTVEESDTNDTLGSTVDEALEALVEDDNQETASTPLVDSMTGNSIIDSLPSSSSSFIGYHDPSPSLNTSSTATTITIGYENMDNFAMVDFSCWLYGAIFVLICLRLPYVKRYFTRLSQHDPVSNDTLPYHTVQNNKELD